MIPYHEIVRVLEGNTLINAESYQCRYEARVGEFEAGFYIIMWPEVVRLRVYNVDAQFCGPFATRKEAATALQRSVENRYFPLDQAVP